MRGSSLVPCSACDRNPTYALAPDDFGDARRSKPGLPHTLPHHLPSAGTQSRRSSASNIPICPRSRNVGSVVRSVPPGTRTTRSMHTAMMVRVPISVSDRGIDRTGVAELARRTDLGSGGGRRLPGGRLAGRRRDIVRHDYLRDAPPAATTGSIMATNPPFVQLDAFLVRTLALLDSGHLSAAVLLVRPDFAGTIGRAAFFNRAAFEFTCCWRIRWIAGTTTQPRWWGQWFVWQAGRNGPPVNRRLRLADLRGLS